MKYILIAALAFASLVNINAQDIKLNEPVKTGGISVMEAFAKRQSSSEFADKELSIQDLSNLLWAANGITARMVKRPLRRLKIAKISMYTLPYLTQYINLMLKQTI